MNLEHVTKQELYTDKDVTILYCYVEDTMYSLCNRRGSHKYLVQCTKLGVYFETDSPEMAHKTMKYILKGDFNGN